MCDKCLQNEIQIKALRKLIEEIRTTLGVLPGESVLNVINYLKKENIEEIKEETKSVKQAPDLEKSDKQMINKLIHQYKIQYIHSSYLRKIKALLNAAELISEEEKERLTTVHKKLSRKNESCEV